MVPTLDTLNTKYPTLAPGDIVLLAMCRIEILKKLISFCNFWDQINNSVLVLRIKCQVVKLQTQLLLKSQNWEKSLSLYLKFILYNHHHPPRQLFKLNLSQIQYMERPRTT